MTEAEAKELTAAIAQGVASVERMIGLAASLGVPTALGATVGDWMKNLNETAGEISPQPPPQRYARRRRPPR
jgi:hypothetical protein